MKYLIAGFCDVHVKPHGRAGLVTFAVEHQFEFDIMPTQEELIVYAEKHGYKVGFSRADGVGIIHGSKSAVVPIYRYLTDTYRF